MKETISFYSEMFGFIDEGEAGPFTTMRINDEFTFQLAPWGTDGGEHFAFALPKNEFDIIFEKIKSNGIAFGDSYHTVGNQTGPGKEEGAKGLGETIYFFDPNKHLLEIRSYDEAKS